MLSGRPSPRCPSLTPALSGSFSLSLSLSSHCLFRYLCFCLHPSIHIFKILLPILILLKDNFYSNFICSDYKVSLSLWWRSHGSPFICSYPPLRSHTHHTHTFSVSFITLSHRKRRKIEFLLSLLPNRSLLLSLSLSPISFSLTSPLPQSLWFWGTICARTLSILSISLFHFFTLLLFLLTFSSALLSFSPLSHVLLQFLFLLLIFIPFLNNFLLFHSYFTHTSTDSPSPPSLSNCTFLKLLELWKNIKIACCRHALTLLYLISHSYSPPPPPLSLTQYSPHFRFFY